MATLNRLTAKMINSFTEAGDYPDGGGLYLQIMDGKASLRKSWYFRFKSPMTRKERCMGLGPLARISLAEARRRRDAARAIVDSDGDPLIEKRRLRATVEEAEKTFDQCARSYFNANKAAWTNKAHADQFLSSLSAYASPVFGSKPVREIDTALVCAALEPIWSEKPTTAGRVRARIEAVLNYAKVKGYRSGENPAAWRGHLSNVLPSVKRIAKQKHLEAMPYADTPAFYRMLAASNSENVAIYALRLIILTAARRGEVIGAKWSEFDLEKATWTIPAERMKARVEHRVPLSSEAIKLLRRLSGIRQNEFVFPGARGGGSMGSATIVKTLRGLGVESATPHGFRSSFRDWTADMTNTPREIAEAALAHATGSATERAYSRSDALEKRRVLMEQWAAYLTA